MKGPYERLKYDLRRVWECPQCGQKQRTDGTVTTMFCKCKNSSNQAVSMKLVADGPRRLVPRVAPPRKVLSLPPEPVASITQVDVVAVTPDTAAQVTITEISTKPGTPPQEAEPNA
jgi:hypothetical protein